MMFFNERSVMLTVSCLHSLCLAYNINIQIKYVKKMIPK